MVHTWSVHDFEPKSEHCIRMRVLVTVQSI